MAKLNNLYYHPSTYKEWHKLDSMIKEELEYEGLYVNEVQRVEDDITIMFEIEDEDMEEEILEHMKQFCSDEREYEYFIKYNYEEDSKEGELTKEMILKVLTKSLKEYDSRIEVIGLYAEYHGVLIRFEFEEPVVKNTIGVIDEESVYDDLKSLILKVSEKVDEEYLKAKIEEHSNGNILDFVVEDVLKDYMSLYFSNYSIDILDGDDSCRSIVSIATGC